MTLMDILIAVYILGAMAWCVWAGYERNDSLIPLDIIWPMLAPIALLMILADRLYNLGRNLAK